MHLPRIYPITDTQLTKLTHTEQVNRLVEGGARLIQLREKEASPHGFFEDARIALESTRGADTMLLINDRVDIALALKAGGVHLGQDDVHPADARKLLGPDAIIGLSTHTVQQAVEAAELPIDYLAIGPVFHTKTKSNTGKTIGIDVVKRVRESVKDFPVVAIGGINRANFRDVLLAGADSVAVISGILSNPENISSAYASFSKQS